MADQEPEVKSGSKKWLFIGIGSTVLVLGAALAAYFLLLAPEAEAKEEEQVPVEAYVNEVIELDAIVANLVDEVETRYARITVALGVFNLSPGNPLIDETIQPKLKDYLLGEISKKSSAQLLQPDQRDALKSQILEFVNAEIDPELGEVLEVYFTEFIIQ